MIKFLAKNSFVFILILCIILHFILDKLVGIKNSWIRFGITLAILFPILPKKKKIKTQSGERTQITWIFLKEPIFID